MECIQGNCETGSDEGLWFKQRQSLGTGNCCTGHAQEGAASEPSAMSVDQQLQPILRNDDVDHRGDNN